MKNTQWKMLKMDRKIKRNNTRLLQVEEGVFGGGGGRGEGEYTVMYIKMLKLNRRQVIKDMCFTVLIRQ